MDRGFPAGEPHGEARIALRARHVFERLLAGADKDRDVEHRERDRACDDRESPAHGQHEEQEAEQADDDRGQRRERLDDRLRHAGHPVLGRILRQVDRRAKREGHTDDKRQKQQVERVEQLRADAAACLELLRLGGEEAHVEELARACNQDVDYDSGQYEQHEAHDGGEDSRSDLVLRVDAANVRRHVELSHAWSLPCAQSGG